MGQMRSRLQARREPDGRVKQHLQKAGNNRRVPVVPLDSTLQDLPHLHLRAHLIQGERTDGLTTWSPRTCKPFKLCLLPAHCILPHLPRAEPTSTLPFPSPTQPSNEARCCGEAAVGPPPCPRASCAPRSSTGSTYLCTSRPFVDLPSLQQNVSLRSAQPADFLFHA